MSGHDDKSQPERPVAILASDASLRLKASNYPEPYFSMMAGRLKRPLGDLFGLKNFGVNLTRLPPGAVSALHHRHSCQDEFVYILEGTPTLYAGDEEIALEPGMCAGFPAGGKAHHLANHGMVDAVILEVGDRKVGDACFYPDDDIQATTGPDGKWRFTHKDGRDY